MSLEATIAENTAAIRELINALLTRGAIPTADQVAAAVPAQAEAVKTAEAAETSKPAATSKPKAEAKKAEASPSTGTTSESAASAAPSDTGASTGSAAPTYDEVKAKILLLAKEKGREATTALLQRHGVAKGPDLKPEQFAEFIADAEKVMAGEYDPMASELA